METSVLAVDKAVDLNAEERIHEYCLKASRSGEDVAAVVREAIADPQLHVFGELLNVPAVQELAGSYQQAVFDLLALYAYGSFSDYKCHASQLPALTEEEVKKLRRLTILSFAARLREISYQDLMKALEVEKLRDLEDLVIELMYASLLRAKMDQRRGVIEVDFAVARDVPQTDVLRRSRLGASLEQTTGLDTMIAALTSWKTNSARLKDGIAKSVELVLKTEELNQEKVKEVEEEVTRLKKSVKEESRNSPHMAAPLLPFQPWKWK